MTPWVVEVGRVLSNEAVDPTLSHLTVSSPRLARAAAAGQFVVIRIPDGAALLPRPFDLHFADAREGTVEVVYRVKGRGTRSLAETAPGAELELHGPFGRDADEVLRGMDRIALVGRGAGVSPLTFLASRARELGVTVDAYLSARSVELLRPFRRLEQLASVVTQTDDRQPGQLVTAQLERDLATHRIDAAFVVGSRRLARATLDLAQRYGLRPYTYAESHMGCGFGHCKGCAVPTRHGYLLACVDGPLIDLEEVNDAYWATFHG